VAALFECLQFQDYFTIFAVCKSTKNMQLFNPLLRWAMLRPMERIEQFVKFPYESQNSVLMRLVASAKDTEWGKRYNYAAIRHYEDFRQRVPLSTYEEIFPYIERMMRGEQQILWHSPVYWFSKSSGTTNARSKFIPVSQESLEHTHFQGGKDLIALYLQQHPGSQVLWGKALSIGGTFQQSEQNENVHYGDVSAVVAQNLPFWAQWLRAPSLRVAHMKKWEEKIEKMAEECIKTKITSLLGVPTWMIVLLQRVLEMTGKKYAQEVWPDLEAFFHGAVAFDPYREIFQRLAPGLNYMEVYNASEGFFALQDDARREDMMLMLDYGIFYEFIPMEELDKEQPKTLSLEQVELHKNYAMVISTDGGLWRYKIGDTVKFTSKFPYRIKISGRTKHFINAFGEELMIENANAAITRACRETGATITDFTACPIYMGGEGSGKGGHEWLIEFDQAPDDFQKFVQLLDKTLREVNSDYDAKRYQDIALQMPLVHQVPKDTFHNWLRHQGRLGGQYKVPRLANSREYVEDILKMLATA